MIKTIIFSLAILASSICYGGDFIVLKESDTSITYIQKDKIIYFKKVEMYGGGIKIIIYTPEHLFEFYNEEIFNTLTKELLNPNFVAEVDLTSKIGPNQSKVHIDNMINEISAWETTSFPWETEDMILRERKKYLIDNLQKLQ